VACGSEAGIRLSLRLAAAWQGRDRDESESDVLVSQPGPGGLKLEGAGLPFKFSISKGTELQAWKLAAGGQGAASESGPAWQGPGAWLGAADPPGPVRHGRAVTVPVTVTTR
jgi:hypothetical protein